ncbi:hypothetical protein [Rhodocaloribacter sp.]|jgi:hypothetical protein
MKLYRVYSDLKGLEVAGTTPETVRVRWFVERYDDDFLAQHIGRCAPAALEEDYLTDLEVELVRQHVKERWTYVGEPVVIEETIDTTDLRRLEELCMEGCLPYRERCRQGAPCLSLYDGDATGHAMDEAVRRIRGLCEVLE